MTWAENSSLKAVTFFFVTQKECDITSQNLQQVTTPAVDGTFKLHAVRVNGSGQLCTRTMSCYCETCITDVLWSFFRNHLICHEILQFHLQCYFI